MVLIGTANTEGFFETKRIWLSCRMNPEIARQDRSVVTVCSLFNATPVL